MKTSTNRGFSLGVIEGLTAAGLYVAPPVKRAANRCWLGLMAMAILFFGLLEQARAQSTYAVGDLLDEVDVESKVTDAATAIAVVLGTIVVVVLAFLLLMRARREAGNAIKGRG